MNYRILQASLALLLIGCADSANLGTSASGSSGAGSSSGSGPLPPPGDPGCGLDHAAFCDTFDTPSPGGNAGDLDDALWSAARISTAVNPTQGTFNAWGATGKGTACGKDTSGLTPPNDMFFCAGGPTESMHFNNAYNDGSAFTVQSWRVKQPFDFTDRTGIITFDATAKSQLPGGHGFWFNVFISEEPVPAPYQLGEGIDLYVKAGVGIEFEAGAGGECKFDGSENSVSQVYVEKDYDILKTVGFTDAGFGDEKTGGPGSALCFKTKDEVLNHIEIHVSQSTIEVYASDAGDPGSLRLVAVAHDLNLPFSRGYVNFQHTHYNAHKCSALFAGIPACVDCQDSCPSLPPWTTYQMDNVGFDGPKFSVPRSYQLPNNTLKQNANVTGTAVVVLPDGTQLDTITFPDPYVHTGYVMSTKYSPSDQGGIFARNGDSSAPIVLHDVDLNGAVDAVLTLNGWAMCLPVKYRFNGGAWQTHEVPYGLSLEAGKVFDCGQATARILPVPLSDLKQGDNKIEMYTDTDGPVGPVIANIELTINTP